MKQEFKKGARVEVCGGELFDPDRPERNLATVVVEAQEGNAPSVFFDSTVEVEELDPDNVTENERLDYSHSVSTDNLRLVL